MSSFRDDDDPRYERRPPARTPQGRENELVALAYEQAELELREGKASQAVLVHLLRIGSEREKQERLKLEAEIALANRKIQEQDASSDVKRLLEEAVDSMRVYRGEQRREYED